MTTITLEVPDDIAEKFSSQKVVPFSNFLEELENNSWHDFDVNMDANDFLSVLETQVLQNKK